MLKVNEKILVFLSILLMVIPVTIFGIKDVEMYYQGIFSNQVINNTFFNPFIFFIDYFGPGVNFPLGNFPFYHPISILFGTNLRLFFLFSGLLNLFLQIIYFNKILKFFGLKKKDRYFSFLIILSISNFNFFWSDDWMSNFYTYTFFFPIFFYYLKATNNKKFLDFLKLGFVFGFAFINSHPGHLVHMVLFLSVFFLINNFKYLVREKYFYLSVIIALLISGESIYFLLDEYQKFGNEVIRIVQSDYSIKHYLASLALPLNFSTVFEVNRYPSNGIFFFIALLSAFQILVKKNSKNFFYIDIIFLVFFLISLSEKIKVISVISCIWQIRDIVNITGFILFFIFLKEIKNNKVKNYIVTINILMIVVFYLGNFYKNIPFNSTDKNIIKNNQISKEFENFVNISKESQIFDNRLYVGPSLYADLYAKKKLYNHGIFGMTDFINLKLSPFNGDFKNISLDKIQTSPSKMRSHLFPNYEEINNEIFLSIFKIKYLIIFESEVKRIKNINNFKILNKKNFDGQEIVFLERKNHPQFTLIKFDDLKKIKCEPGDLIDCIKKYENYFFLTQNAEIKKINGNSYEYQKLANEKNVLITHFLFDKNWVSNDKKAMVSFDNRLLALKFNEKVLITYKNKTRYYLLLTSLTIILLLSIYFISIKIFKNKKSSIKKSF